LAFRARENVVVTNGGMHGLYVLFRAMLDAGDEVILPDPMWTEIAENIRLGGGTPVPVRLHPENGYQYDPDEIESAITPRTRAIFVNTPHNPTGAIASRETLERIAAIAANHNLTLISDEAYEHVIFDGQKHVSLGSLPARAGTDGQRLLDVEDLRHERTPHGLPRRHG
jgi:aspartate aminotransferase